jgi:hypothetical protein
MSGVFRRCSPTKFHQLFLLLLRRLNGVPSFGLLTSPKEEEEGRPNTILFFSK